MATTIDSPVPGTFYRRPDPASDAFVDEGDTIAVGDVIGLIEIMKSFHEIKAEVSGTIARFLVENEATVDIGQPLVELAP